MRCMDTSNETLENAHCTISFLIGGGCGFLLAIVLGMLIGAASIGYKNRQAIKKSVIHVGRHNRKGTNGDANGNS